MDSAPRNISSPPLVVGFVSLGCPKNLIDSERMLANLALSGYVVTGDLDAADVAVVNTCGFIGEAREESNQVIGDLVDRKRRGRLQMVVVTGCYAQGFKDDVLDAWPDVDAVVGLSAREEVGALIAQLVNQRSDLPLEHVAPQCRPPMYDGERLRLTPRHYAYLRITEGCDNRCSYCMIPAIRGPLASKSVDAIVTEAHELIADGAGELIIIGQDTTAYGRDQGGATEVADVLRELDGLAGLHWLRLLYTHPGSFGPRLVAAYAELEHLLPYVNLPLQHLSQPILDSMGRRTTRAGVEQLIDSLRRARPELLVRTTFIVGYPGETDAQFEELLDFVRQQRFDRLGGFTYGLERDTPAALLPDQVPERVKKERLRALMTLQEEIAAENQRQLVGQRLEVVIDRGSTSPKRAGLGRFWGQAPEIDGVTHVYSKAPLLAGSLVSGKVVDAGPHDLELRVTGR